MFSYSLFSEKKTLPLAFQTEEESVRYFIQNSYHFQQMIKSAERYVPEPGKENDLARIVTNVKKSVDYCDLQHTLNHYDVNRSDNIFAYNMGRNKMSIFCGFFGFIWERWNFCYHAIELLRNSEAASKLYHQQTMRLH